MKSGISFMSVPSITNCEHLKEFFSDRNLFANIHGEHLQRCVQSFSLILLSLPPDSDSCMLQSKQKLILMDSAQIP